MPKDPKLLQRRNKVSTRATLPSVEQAAEREVPPLPVVEDVAWHPAVVEWWATVWKSPMAGEFLASDIQGGLRLIAELYQDFFNAETVGDRRAIAAEIRQQEVRFGLSPMDRRRLQWEVEKGEDAAARTAKRRERAMLPVPGVDDPRTMLRVV